MEGTLCRICLKQGALCSIFTKHDTISVQFSSMLDYCASIKVDINDGLPDEICEECANTLVNFYKFRIMARDNDHTLRQRLLMSEVVVKTEIDQVNCVFIESEHHVEVKEEIKKKENLPKDSVKYSNQCEICGTVITHRSNYYRHVKSHSGERPHACEMCGKKFLREADLKTHKRVHTGEKPYQCVMCPKSCSSASSLRNHKLTHLDISESPHKCPMCDRHFRHESDMAIHIRFHNNERPFDCKICNKTFVTRSDLLVHIRSHTGERPFKCHHCEKGFTTGSHLKRHMKRHADENLHKCGVCGEGFIWKRSLKDHMKAH